MNAAGMRKMRGLSFGLLLSLCGSLSLAACAGGGGGSAPSVSTTPAPTPAAPDNYLPVANSAAFNVDVPQGLDYYLPSAPLATPSTYAPTCSSAVGTFGDYTIDGEIFVPDTEQQVSMLGALVLVHTVLLLSKNRAGDAVIVGEVIGNQNGSFVARCVTPYPLIEAAAKKGDTWSYTDIAGNAVTATVVFDHQPKSYPNPPSTPAPYSDVTEVNYGADQTIDWASGYGPVQIVEHGAQGNEPRSYTAYDYSVVAGSK